MNISSAGAPQILDNIQKLFDILKTAQAQTMELSDKMLKVNVTAAVQSGLGENIDLSV
jgi:hypothetical protein